MDKNIPVIKATSPQLVFISREKWDEMMSKSIPADEWHFERVDKGVIPVKGKYDNNNPNHIGVDDIIHISCVGCSSFYNDNNPEIMGFILVFLLTIMFLFIITSW